jgi:hypothetical protein
VGAQRFVAVRLRSTPTILFPAPTGPDVKQR